MREYNPITNTFIKVSGGGTGTSNYNDLENKPSINDVPLIGNKTLTQLGIDFNNYYTKDETYTKLEVDNLIPSTEDFATKEELNTKQDILTAGTNITIENNVISASGGSGTIDTEMSPTSENAVQNKVITSYVDDMYNGILQALDEGYQPLLTEGTGIDITPSNQISVDNTVALKSEQSNINIEYSEGEISVGEIAQGNKKIRLTTKGTDGVHLAIVDGNNVDGRILADSEYFDTYTSRFAKALVNSSSMGSLYGDDANFRLSLNVSRNNLPTIEITDTPHSVVETQKILATKDYVDTEVATKQDTLVSGTNIKSINGQSLLGSGNLSITGNEYIIDLSNPPSLAEIIEEYQSDKVFYAKYTQSGVSSIYPVSGLTTTGQDEVGNVYFYCLLSEVSTLAVTINYEDGGREVEALPTELAQKAYLDAKQDKLVSGTNIKTVANQSLLGNGDIEFKTINSSAISGSGNLTTGKVSSDYQTNSTTIYEGTDNSVQIAKVDNDTIQVQGYGVDDRGQSQTLYNINLPSKSYVDNNVGVHMEVGVEKPYGTFTENGVTYQTYTKTVFVPALSNTAGITTYDHGISGIKQIIGVFGFGTNGFVLNSPRQNAVDNIAIYQVSKSATNQTFSIEVGKDRSNMGAYVTLIYAKNN